MKLRPLGAMVFSGATALALGTPATVTAVAANPAAPGHTAAATYTPKQMIERALAKGQNEARWRRTGNIPKRWKLIKVTVAEAAGKAPGYVEMATPAAATKWVVLVELLWDVPKRQSPAVHTIVFNYRDGKATGSRYVDEPMFEDAFFTKVRHDLAWAWRKQKAFQRHDSEWGYFAKPFLINVREPLTSESEGNDESWIFSAELRGGTIQHVFVNDRTGEVTAETD